MANTGRPLKFKTVKELQAKIDAYFKECDERTSPYFHAKTGMTIQLPDPLPYTITGLALYLDTTRETLLDYQERDEFSDTIRKAKLRCENYAEQSLWKPKIATGVIFNLTNNYGWKNKQEVDNKKTFDITGLEDLEETELDDLIKALQSRTGNSTD